MQISPVVSEETQRLLDMTVQKRGLKKGFLIETALRHYLVALNTIPGDFIVPPVLSVSAEGWGVLMQSLEDVGEPAPALTSLMPRCLKYACYARRMTDHGFARGSLRWISC